MERIKNFNQVILAIGGVIGIIILIMIAIMVLSEISNIFRFRSYDNNTGVIATNETDKLVEDDVRKQVISFNNVLVIDSVSQTYLLPVTQANLENDEFISESGGYSSSYSKRGGGFVSHNNLVVKSFLNNTTNVVFTERGSISKYKVKEHLGNKFIVIAACKTDTNSDKILNHSDLQKLFVYDIKNEKLTEISLNSNYTILSIIEPQKSNDMIVKLGFDRDGDNNFESKSEPQMFYKLNFENVSLEPFVSTEITNQLQKLLEGK